MRLIDITNQNFGNLTVIKKVPNEKGRQTNWLCKCSCGNITIVSKGHLTTGHTKSCGCLSFEALNKNRYKHGLCQTRLYGIHAGIKDRCYNIKNKKYNYYGNRGIKVYDDWLDKKNGFINFYNWAINNGYKDNLTIDRIDVNGNYEPNNCRWATMKQQANNRRNNHYITYNNETHTITEWSKILNINRYTLYDRINKSNMSIEKALTKKVNHKNKEIKNESNN